MEKLKELIRRAGHSTVPAAWLMNDAPLDGSKSKLERLTDFAEALIAEIAKSNAPVAWMQISVEEGIDERFPRASKPPEFNPDWWKFEPLYTFPPSTEQIENRVAEACAEFVHVNMISSEYPTNISEALRSGAWKGYLK